MALRILDIFAHHESLSAYQVFSKLKSSFFESAYKNVHKRIQRLQSLLLIEEIKNKTVRAKHGAKYYRLTEYGIYKLFLDRVVGVYSDTLPRKKLKK
jgi:predicted transcriptional regulator with HTH domain